MIKCAIFDADGTLINSLHLWRQADEEYMASIGRRLDPEVYKKFEKLTYRQSVSYLKRHYGLEQTEDEISDGVMAIVAKKYDTEVTQRDGIDELLERLLENGIKMAVATANDKKLVCRGLRSTGLRRYFSFVISCDETGAGKDDAEIYVRAAELLGCKPEETLVVEDDKNYIKAARDAGFIAIHVSEMGRLGFGK